MKVHNITMLYGKNHINLSLLRGFYVTKGIRLSLISSENAITALLFILCLCKRKLLLKLVIPVVSVVLKNVFSGIDLFQLADIPS